MGEARRRGTFEERKAEAIEKKEQEAKPRCLVTAPLPKLADRSIGAFMLGVGIEAAGRQAAKLRKET